MRALDARRLMDADADAVRRSHERAIRELQATPAAALKVIEAIELADGVATTIAHGLGRAPLWVGISVPRGPSTSGRVEELRDIGSDRARAIVLEANGYGATITVDVVVL